MTKLNIAAQLKQAFEDSSSFDNHPLQGASFDNLKLTTSDNVKLTTLKG